MIGQTQGNQIFPRCNLFALHWIDNPATVNFEFQQLTVITPGFKFLDCGLGWWLVPVVISIGVLADFALGDA